MLVQRGRAMSGTTPVEELLNNYREHGDGVQMPGEAIAEVTRHALMAASVPRPQTTISVSAEMPSAARAARRRGVSSTLPSSLHWYAG